MTASQLVQQAFQSTLPRRERQKAQKEYWEQKLFQSTLPRRERLAIIGASDLPNRISIHAPAKGATSSATAVIWCSKISIHAPAKGATTPSPTYWTNKLFQSTLPRRERHGTVQKNVYIEHDFNPRSREGSDNNTYEICVVKQRFQSTLPRRERPICADRDGKLFAFQSTLPRRERLCDAAVWSIQRKHFNPRSREGSDTLHQ